MQTVKTQAKRPKGCRGCGELCGVGSCPACVKRTVYCVKCERIYHETRRYPQPADQQDDVTAELMYGLPTEIDAAIGALLVMCMPDVYERVKALRVAIRRELDAAGKRGMAICARHDPILFNRPASQCPGCALVDDAVNKYDADLWRVQQRAERREDGQ